jgi:predicted nucleotidyltransferase
MRRESFTRDKVLEELRHLKPVLEKQYGVMRIGIFGSFAKNKIREDTDIDVVIELKEPDLFSLVHIKKALEEDFHRRVDVISLREHMNPYLKRRIQTEAIYV